MDPDRHAEASRLFLAATRLPAEARPAFLAGASVDQEVRQLAQDLLRHDRPAGEPASGTTTPTEGLADLVGRALLDARADKPPDHTSAPSGRRVGEYELLEVIGRGGAGVVYRAWQPRLDRAVALKLLLATTEDDAGARRLELEARVLAMLDHPGIARVLDSGVDPSPDGPRPYLVMELVHGLPITEWCRRHEPGRRARLELMAQVCDAVHHAHQRGVLHRDLKPPNLLVTEEGRPRVLDFGLARHLERASGLTRQAGEARSLLGTVGYMAPEVLSQGIAQADVRADVYALGVITFELLAGRPPVDLRGRGLVEVVRLVTEQPAPRLGARDRSLRGDAEAVVARALARDPDLRYGTVDDLRRDLLALARGDDVSARRPGLVTSLWRGLRRHALVVTSVAGLLLALLAGLLVQRSARLDLQREVEALNAVHDHLITVFNLPPEGSLGDPSLREMLAAGEGYVASHLAEGPDLVVAYLDSFLGRVSLGLAQETGDQQVGLRLMQRSCEAFESALGWADRRVPANWLLMAALLATDGRGPEADGILSRVDQLGATLLDGDPALRLSRLSLAARRARQAGRSAQALASYRAAYELARALQPGPLGGFQLLLPLCDLSEPAEAVDLLARVGAELESAARARGEEQALANVRQRVRFLEALAKHRARLAWEGQDVQLTTALQDSLDTSRQAYELALDHYGRTAPLTLRVALALVDRLLDLGRVDQAQVLLESVLPEARAAHGRWDERVLQLEGRRLEALAQRGAACELQRDLPDHLAAWRELGPAYPGWAHRAALTGALAALESGRVDQAGALIGQVLADLEVDLPSEGYAPLTALVWLAGRLDVQAAGLPAATPPLSRRALRWAGR